MKEYRARVSNSGHRKRELRNTLDRWLLSAPALIILFFAAIGLSTNVTAFVDSAPELFLYALLLIALHLIFVLLIAKLFKFDLAEALIGSAAALVGPGPTAAIASSNGWHHLISPGILCGLFGYIIANFIGVTLTKLLG